MTSSSLFEKLAELPRRAARGMRFGLERMEEALDVLGRPHERLAAVHVGGSNGKGSTSAMVESIARAAGLRTGLYTSPHLCRYAERIRFDGEPIGDDALDRALDAVFTRCRDDLTFFESLTLAAFYAFAEADVDLVVLEVGLGGRLDATNVIHAPIATAITTIALEHTEILGDTLAAIAREKAGILKPGAPVVLGPLDPEADQVIAAIAERASAFPVTRVTRAALWEPGSLSARWDGATTEIVGPRTHDRVSVKLRLAGLHQAENAAVAVGLAHHLAESFPGRDLVAAIPAGLERTEWPGRLERIDRDGVTVILDCAHNPSGIEKLLLTLSTTWPGSTSPERVALVFGALADKRFADMLALLAPIAARRYYAEPKGRPPAPRDELNKIAPGAAVPAPKEAIARALAESRPGDTILVTGSIYLVGEIRAALLGIEADPIIAL